MKKIIVAVFLVAILMGMLSPTPLPAQNDTVCELDVIVQVDDWLSKLSDKFYGDVLAYPAIAEATNSKAAQDNTYAVIDDVNLIEPGWKLCIIGVDAAEELLGEKLENAPLFDDTPINLNGVIAIGAAHALSGPLSQQGKSIQTGINMAVKEINEAAFLGDATLQVIWKDTAGNQAQAIDAFNELITQDQVAAILGPTLSHVAFETNPVAQAKGVPVIGSSNIAEGVTTIGEYIFRTSLPESTIIFNTVQRVKDEFALQSVVIVYDNSNLFTRTNLHTLQQALKSEGVEIMDIIPYSTGEPEFSERLAEFQTFNPDAIFLLALSKDAANIITQARQTGIIKEDTSIIGSNSLNTLLFLEEGQDAVTGTVVGTAWAPTISSGSTRQFVADYETEYGLLPDHLAAQSYTAAWALATALRQSNSTERSVVRDALDTLEFMESPLGIFSFDENGNPNYSPVIQVVENGEFVLFP